jgi:hypothetical protein
MEAVSLDTDGFLTPFAKTGGSKDVRKLSVYAAAGFMFIMFAFPLLTGFTYNSVLQSIVLWIGTVATFLTFILRSDDGTPLRLALVFTIAACSFALTILAWVHGGVFLGFVNLAYAVGMVSSEFLPALLQSSMSHLIHGPYYIRCGLVTVSYFTAWFCLDLVVIRGHETGYVWGFIAFFFSLTALLSTLMVGMYSFILKYIRILLVPSALTVLMCLSAQAVCILIWFGAYWVLFLNLFQCIATAVWLLNFAIINSEDEQMTSL